MDYSSSERASDAGPTAGPDRQPGFSDRAGVIAEAAERIVNESRAMLYDVAGNFNLKERVERHPIRAVVIAAGVGYVLGGGLFTRYTGRMTGLAMRLAVLPFVRRELAGIAKASMMGDTATRVHQ
jgi:hypothetical protein